MIKRDPESAAASHYDLIVIGGGIYGSHLALEATLRGFKTLLLEKKDFGWATSWNSFRIAHGGFRYLQTLDLVRFFQSVKERKWLLTHFPDLVKPLPCLMPLYGKGTRFPLVLRIALALNDFLSRNRNEGLVEDQFIPSGTLLSPSQTVSLFPTVETQGLRGSALWHDAVIKCPQRVLMEVLRWAVHGGATCLNYVRAECLISDNGDVQGG